MSGPRCALAAFNLPMGFVSRGATEFSTRFVVHCGRCGGVAEGRYVRAGAVSSLLAMTTPV
jgi:hypothetical protein